MNRLSDQMLAKGMLEARDRGVSFSLHVRRHRAFYGLFAAYFSVLLAVLAWMQLWLPFCLVGGLCAGSLLRDVGWIRATRKAFPFYLKVTDWGKVESLASDELRASPSDAADSR